LIGAIVSTNSMHRKFSMSETSKQTSSFDAAIKACRRYLMENVI